MELHRRSRVLVCPYCSGELAWKTKAHWKMDLGVCRTCGIIFIQVTEPGVYAVTTQAIHETLNQNALPAPEHVAKEKLPNGMDALDVRLAIWIEESRLEEGRGGEPDPGGPKAGGT